MKTTGSSRDPLEELLEQARQDGFTPAETQELWSRVGAASSGTGGTPAGASKVAAGGAIKSAVWMIGGGILVVGGGLFALHLTSGGSPRSQGSQHEGSSGLALGKLDELHRDEERQQATTDVPNAGVTALAPMLAEGNAGGRGARPLSSLPRASLIERGRLSPTARPDFASVPPHATSPSEKVEPRAEKSVETRAASPRDLSLEPKVSAPPRAAEQAVGPVAPPPEKRSEPTPEPAPTPSSPLLGEGGLLLRARQQLTSDPSAALALTQEHARRFPAGALTPEREVLAIEALARLGRSQEARARLTAFRARFPRSSHLARLQALVDQECIR